MKHNENDTNRDWNEFYEIYRSLPWYDRLHLRLVLVWKSKHFPQYLTRPPLRISVLYILALIVLTNGIGRAAGIMEYVIQVGGAISFALIGNEILRLYGNTRRSARFPGNPTGD